MTKIPFYRPGGDQTKPIAWFDTNDKVYFGIIDGRVHLFKKFDNAKAISLCHLKKLEELGCKTLRFTVTNFEKENFDIIVSFKTFMEKSEEINYLNKKNADFQRMLRLQFWTRIYASQRTIPQTAQEVVSCEGN